MATLDIAVPTSRMVDPETGMVEAPWRQFLLILLQRTGGTVGHDSGGISSSLAAETTARQNADNTLQTNINNEASARQAADAGLVQVSQLAVQWSILNLGFMRTTDPGGGRPWLKAGGLHVGP